ncbi:MAG: hypothetical protein ABEK16_03305 [Candidatus Nanohalobium sp.]
MIQFALFLLLAAFLMGLVGYSIHDELEVLVVDLLTGSVSLTGLSGSWRVLTGFLLVFSVPAAAFAFVSVIYFGDNPDRREQVFQGLKRTFISLVLVSVSFFLYRGVLGFFQGFTDLGFVLVSPSGGSFRESVFYSPVLETDVSLSSVVSGSAPSEVLRDVYKNGVYTVSLLFLVGTLAVQRVLARFGVLLMPIGVFLYNLPFSVFDDWSLGVLKGLALVLFLPVLDVLLLGVIGSMPRGSRAEEVTYILSFTVLALINWSVVKKVVLTPFRGRTSVVKGLRFLRKVRKSRRKQGEDEVGPGEIRKTSRSRSSRPSRRRLLER